MKKTDLAYIAGIIDGEGCIRFGKRTNGVRYVGISVGMTNEWIIKWLYFNFGGYLHERLPQGNRQVRWDWELKTRQATNFLKLILPYLKIKRPHAELAIEFQFRRRYRGHQPMSNEDRALDEADAILMRSYNKRGRNE